MFPPQRIVLDPFAGSGTILIAAERTGRRARAIEIDPGYVDVAIRRWQKYTGKSAILAGTHQTFEEIEEQRAKFGLPDTTLDHPELVIDREVRDDAEQSE